MKDSFTLDLLDSVLYDRFKMPLFQKLALVTLGGVIGVWAQQNYAQSIPNLKDQANVALDKLKSMAGK